MKRLLTLIFTGTMAIAAYAQNPSIGMQVVASAGGYKDNISSENGLSVSWTVGEMAYTTLKGGNYMLTQGFQQGNLFSTSAEKPELPGSEMISVYPNPASVEFFIDIAAPAAEGRGLAELYDIAGRKVLAREFWLGEAGPHRVPIDNLKAGIYMVKVTVDSSTTKVFKLIKR